MATLETPAAALFTARLPARRPWWERALHTRNLMLGIGLLGVILLLAIAAPLVTPYGPYTTDYAHALQPPSLQHLFGTDMYGRDIFTRVLYGGRIDLQVGVLSVLAPFLIGTLLGALAGYFGGWWDTLVMRIVDVVQAFPFIILIIAIVAILGPGLRNMYVAVALVAWVVYARLIRGEILVEKQKEYVLAARALGNTDSRVIFRHLMPNVILPSLVFATADMALYILLAAALSFLGLGVKPPTPEWGAMITEGQPFMTTAWWISALPGTAIIATGIALSLIGDGLADLFRLR